MANALLTALVRFGIRHERALAIASGIWFALGCAAASGMVDLPKIPFVTDALAFWLAGAWNAVWWGAAHPLIERRKAELTLAATAAPGETSIGS